MATTFTLGISEGRHRGATRIDRTAHFGGSLSFLAD